MKTKFHLEMLSGSTPGKIFPIEKDEIAVGREPTCDIVINDTEVSRKHLRLFWSEPGYILEDLGSTNGVLINNKKLISPQGLHGGEKITLGGNVVLEYIVTPISLDETIVSQMDPLATESTVNQHASSASGTSEIDPELINSMAENLQNDLSAEMAPEDPSKIDPHLKGPQNKSRNRKFLWIILIIVLFALIGLGLFYLYQAPTSFWCDNFSFYFKPELYPECIP